MEAASPRHADLSGTGPLTVGLELTTPATAAAGAACRLARVLGTTVDAVHVVPTIRVPGTMADTGGNRREGTNRSRASRALCRTRDRSVRRARKLIVESGDVGERLAAAGAGKDASGRLVILGRRSPGSRSGPPGAIAAASWPDSSRLCSSILPTVSADVTFRLLALGFGLSGREPKAQSRLTLRRGRSAFQSALELTKVRRRFRLEPLVDGTAHEPAEEPIEHVQPCAALIEQITAARRRGRQSGSVKASP